MIGLGINFNKDRGREKKRFKKKDGELTMNLSHGIIKLNFE